MPQIGQSLPKVGLRLLVARLPWGKKVLKHFKELMETET